MAKKSEEKAAPITVRLRNRTRSQLVFNLPHATYCSTGPCACTSVSTTVQDYDYRNEEHVTKVVDRLICASSGWLVGETLECDPRVLLVPEIAEAIQRGQIAKV